MPMGTAAPVPRVVGRFASVVADKTKALSSLTVARTDGLTLTSA